MLDFMKGAHAQPFSFIGSVEVMSEHEMTARADFFEEKTYKQCCQNAWPLIVESLAQAAGVHIKNRLDPNYNGYLVGLDDLHVKQSGDIMSDYRLVTKMISRLDKKYLYHCEAFTKTNQAILSCKILLSNSD
ncbi:hypothetical protein C3460_00270 [Serratia marcescens]|uniref:hypothetical protein n=1 Tax=Serratia marcescens TaxID=615 RepID=UPI000CDE1C83|nr:hypothetical protein [Serratia marcescens]POW98538.1 hypothetical protein C3462_00270 [Serratia marcescens]POX02449.1 hypothetical protein C3466_00270 [Serratia marcescens]POX16673.1 hypothetical protein C3460_00270 [Serratia marcescens]